MSSVEKLLYLHIWYRWMRIFSENYIFKIRKNLLWGKYLYANYNNNCTCNAIYMQIAINIYCVLLGIGTNSTFLAKQILSLIIIMQISSFAYSTIWKCTIVR